MAKTRSWVLTDVDRNLWVDTIFLGHEELGVPDCTVSKRTLRGGLRDGVEAIEVTNGELSYTILPTRGMNIWRGDYKGRYLGWEPPVQGPVHPRHVNVNERGGLGWLYGFDEWMARCGLDSNGAPGEDVIIDNNGNESRVTLTLHGKISNLPAHYIEIQSDPDNKTVSVIGHVNESALYCPSLQLRSTISTTPMSNQLRIDDEIVNLKGTNSELELLYHVNYGRPFLEGGAKLVAPVVEAAPRDARAAEGVKQIFDYLPPTPGYVEQVYFYELAAGKDGKSLVSLQNASADLAAVLRFKKSELPWLCQWKNTIDLRDGYCTGIEPGTNFPNVKTVEREKGRVIVLKPGESYRCALEMETYVGKDEVKAVTDEVAALQSGAAGKVHEKPIPRFS